MARLSLRLQRYRWKELGLLIIPFMILLLEMMQLFLVDHVDPLSPLTAKSLPPLYNFVPVLGLVVALLGANLLLSMFFRKADQMLLPLVGLLRGMGVVMAIRLGPDICFSLPN